MRNLLCVAALAIASCEASPEATIPTFTDGGMLRNGTALERDQLLLFEGMFDAVSGEDLFGPQVAVRSSPYLLVTTGARKPKTANVAAGTVPSRPARASPNPRSAPMISSSGVMPVTAVRRFSAVSAIASPAHRARCPRVARPGPPGVGAVAAGMVNTCSEVATNDGIMG
jgi:hypothetical protein